MKKMVIIVTVPLVLDTWFKGQAKFLAQYYDVTLITANANSVKRIEDYEQVPVETMDFTRKINVLKDLKVLLHLLFYLIQNKPEIVYTLTPKAGLLGMIASWMARVPYRVHNVVGLPHLEAQGKRKIILELTEKLTYWFATKIYCNSINLKEEIEGKLTSRHVGIIGHGSVNGVDTEYFKDTLDDKEKKIIYDKLHIAPNDFVITFVGRIVKDKGIDELVRAFCDLKDSNVRLLLIGDYEDDLDPISACTKVIINENEMISQIPYQQDIRTFLAISSLFVLPSYREGLPNVLLEAGSYGIPLVATNINGCNEIITHEENGCLVKPKDAQDLFTAMHKFISDKVYYKKIKDNVRESIKRRYAQEDYLNNLRKEFLEIEKL